MGPLVPLACLVLLLLEPSASADTTAAVYSSATTTTTTSRRLGDVSSFIDNGKWLEFDSTNVTDSFATPCNSSCSTAASSQALGSNESPWVYSSTNCTNLTVLQGFETGDSIYLVTDAGRILGNTSQGSTGTSCGSDPTVCVADDKAGRLSVTLGRGSHSIKIQVKFQQAPIDGGWFQIKTTPCPTTTAPTTKAPTKAPSTTSTPATKKPTKAPSTTSSPSTVKCISPLKCAQYIKNNALCGCKKAINGRRKCIRKKAQKRCCPVGRPDGYVKLVAKKFVRLCTKGARNRGGGGGGGGRRSGGGGRRSGGGGGRGGGLGIGLGGGK